MKSIFQTLRICLFISVGLILAPFILGIFQIGGDAIREAGWVISLLGVFFTFVLIIAMIIVRAIIDRQSDK